MAKTNYGYEKRRKELAKKKKKEDKRQEKLAKRDRQPQDTSGQAPNSADSA